MSTEIPSVDEAYTQRVFSALMEMEVPLDADPLSMGPKRLNGKIALCRQHLEHCNRIYLQVSNDLRTLNRSLRSTKVTFDLQMQDLLANDPETRAGRNVRDREAIATMKLRDTRELMATIESNIQDLDAVMSVVKAKRDDLRDIQGRIRDQLKLCQAEIEMGGVWGSALPPGQRPVAMPTKPRIDPAILAAVDTLPGADQDLDLSDLEKFTNAALRYAGRDAEIVPATPTTPTVPEPVAVVPTPAPAPVPQATAPLPQVTGTDKEFDALLNDLFSDDASSAKPPTPAPNPKDVSDIDLDDLLNAFG